MSFSVRGLNVRYGKSHVVFDLDLEVGDGEVVALLGRNGAGKTTTLLGILGLVPGVSGSVQVDGVEVGRMPTHRRVRTGIGYVPSGARCFPNLTVGENLEVAARSLRNGREGFGKERAYELFPKPRELQSNLAGGLSGGERQMLGVARALVSNPRIVLMDEPTEGLAPVIVQAIGRLVLELKQNGTAILLAEQNHKMALKVADRAAFVEKGQIVEVMPAAEAAESQTLHRILGV